VKDDATALLPLPVRNLKEDRVAMITAEGRMLVFSLSELPELARGKGNKLIVLKGVDRILFWTVIPSGASLVIPSGQRVLTLNPKDWKEYEGSRASRGSFLPRGYRTVQGMRAEVAKTSP